MAEPQGGGGVDVTTYEAIVLAMLGYEPMAANYGDDDDWCGLTLDDVDTYIERKTVDLSGWSYSQPVGFDFIGFQGWAPFQVWDDKGKDFVHKMRLLSRHCDAYGDEHDEDCPLCGVDVTPTCDICGEEWEDGGEGEDWNGDTGNHHSCEARDDARVGQHSLASWKAECDIVYADDDWPGAHFCRTHRTVHPLEVS